MEKEVIERLERVSTSIASKNEKLRKMQEAIIDGERIIKSLQAELRGIEEQGQIDFEIAKEKADIEEYEVRNRQIETAIECLDAETQSAKFDYELRIKETEDIVNSCEKGRILIKTHCLNLQDHIRESEEEFNLTNEDLGSAISEGNRLEHSTSTKVVSKQIASNKYY
jgi:predicted transcriptional regulator